MTTLREWLVRVRATFGVRRRDADLEEELRLHLELAAEQERRRGAPAHDARRAARIHLGNVTETMNVLRDQRSLPWLEDLFQDVRFGWRGLRRTPVFATAIVLSLALGIGANSALFSLIDATVLRKLSVEAPDELVQLRWESRAWFPDSTRFGGTGAATGRLRRSPTFSNAAFDALHDRSSAPGSTAPGPEALSALFGFSRIMSVSAAIDHQAGAATMQLVTADYFTGLRVRPEIGRILTRADDNAATAPAAVVSHGFWRRRFQQAPGAIGAIIVVDGIPITVVGVAPAGFRGVASAGVPGPDVWLPRGLATRFGSENAAPDFWWLSVMGRRQPGVTLDQVRSNLAGTFRSTLLATDTAPASDTPELHVWPGARGAREEGPEDELEHAVILGGIFGFLLFIVCLNVANLLLSRSAARRTEIAIRLALGAHRGRLVRQLLTESVMLAIAGGVAGLFVAIWGRELFGASTLVPRDLDLRIDAGVFGVTLLVSTTAGLVFGLVPARRMTRAMTGRPVERLELRRRSSSRLTSALLVMQVATSVVLLVGAGLFIRTLGHWNRIDAGFDTRNLLVLQIDAAPLGYDDARAALLRERMGARIRAVPGVAAITTSSPFWQQSRLGRPIIDGRPGPSGHGAPGAYWQAVRHDFFETLRVPLLAGRGFRLEEDDTPGPPSVCVIDETFARRFFDRASPIGHRVAFKKGGPEIEIVGVVGTMWIAGTRPEDVNAKMYLPQQTKRAHFDPGWEQWKAKYHLADETSFEIRTAADPMSLLPAIRTAVSELEPNLSLLDPKTVEEGVQEKLSPTRVTSFIWLAFGGVALVLTGLGLYGLLGYNVAQRTREIGIRTALGARRSQIIQLAARQTAVLVSLGIGIGLGLSVAVNQLVRAFIFGVTPSDPLTLAGVVVLLVAVTGVAAFQPMRKALRLDPTVALRTE